MAEMPPNSRAWRNVGSDAFSTISANLEVMAGNGFVMDERAQPELRHALGPQRHLKHRGTRAVEGRRRVDAAAFASRKRG